MTDDVAVKPLLGWPAHEPFDAMLARCAAQPAWAPFDARANRWLAVARRAVMSLFDQIRSAIPFFRLVDVIATIGIALHAIR